MSEQTVQNRFAHLDPEKCTRQATMGGFIFTAIYALFGVLLMSNGNTSDDQLIGVFCLINAAIFLIGSFLAQGGNHSPARVLWLIAGFLGIPLGLVMVGLANRMHGAIKAAEQARDEQGTSRLLEMGTPSFSGQDRPPAGSDVPGRNKAA